MQGVIIKFKKYILFAQNTLYQIIKDKLLVKRAQVELQVQTDL